MMIVCVSLFFKKEPWQQGECAPLADCAPGSWSRCVYVCVCKGEMEWEKGGGRGEKERKREREEKIGSTVNYSTLLKMTTTGSLGMLKK